MWGIRDQKLAEFEALAEGDMTVQHYECKFIELWRYAEDLVEKEKEKIQQFLKGLKSAIRKDVTSVELHTYAAVVKKALWSEKVHNEINEKRNLKNKNRPQGGNNKNASHNSINKRLMVLFSLGQAVIFVEKGMRQINAVVNREHVTSVARLDIKSENLHRNGRHLFNSCRG